MTRYPPQGAPAGEYTQDGPPYGYQQGQYNAPAGTYGAYGSGENQGYPTQTPHYGQQSYGNDGLGSAQSYYAQNDQPYQQYPPHAPQYGSEFQQPFLGSGAPPGPPSGSQQPYAGQYPPPEYPPYGQRQYGGAPPPPQYGSESVASGSPYPSQAYPTAAGDSSQPSTGEDRGLMGALAGGAAGAYGGHQVNHGFLGGIGGAVAGSVLEDAYKKKQKEMKPKKVRSRRGSHCSSSSSSDSDSDGSKKQKQRAASPVMAGNFFQSSRNVRLEGRCTLVAECTDVNGHHRYSDLDLNDCFTNTNGRLCWARGGNFAASARNIRLVDSGNAVEAELGNGHGGWDHNRVWLNERISNDNGRLKLL